MNNNFIKIYINLILLVSLCIMCTGCIELKVQEELTINTDRTAVHSLKCLVNDEMDGFSERINETISSKLQEAGFVNIIPAKEMGFFGMKGTKHQELNQVTQSFGKYFSFFDNSTDYFLFKYIDVTLNIDMTSILHDIESEIVTLTEYKFILNLPVKIKQSNSNRIYNKGKSAIWYLGKNMDNSIHVEFIAWNIENIILTTILLFIILLIFLTTIVARKNAKNTKLHTNNEQNSVALVKKDICPHCSAILDDNAKFCGNCGNKIY